MTEAHHDVRIARPVEEVFDFLADGANNPRWQPLVVRTARSGGAVEAGSTIRQQVRYPLGFTVSADCRITAYERPRHLTMVVTSGGPVRPTLTYALTPADGQATTVRCTVEYHPSGPARLAAPAFALLRPLFAWEASWVERARHVLEQGTLRSSQ